MDLDQRKCCAVVAAENKRLLRALEKEKQRKLYVMTAYKKLLSAYQSVVDLKEVLDSSTSTIQEEEGDAVEDGEKENLKHPPKPIKEVDKRVVQQMQEDFVEFKEVQSTRSSIRKITCQPNISEIPHSSRSNPEDQKQTPMWYFLAMENEYENGRRLIEGNRIDHLLRKSGERSQMIASTSQRRATIAANRRAVAMDVIRGKRQLDEEALRILHTDSSQISAFPNQFMKEMTEKAKRRYKQSQLRLERERGNFRERQLEMATNKVLAHSSAAIAKTVANMHHARFSRTFSTLNIGH